MKNNIAWSLALGFTILALVVLGFFVVRPVLAQVVASSTELILGTTAPSETIDSASASTTEPLPGDPAVLGASTSTEESGTSTPADSTSAVSEATSSTTEIPTPTPAESSVAQAQSESAPAQTEVLTQATTTADGLVEVQLECPMSYTAVLYDTPSGHLDEGYFLGAVAASTTGMTAAHEVGTQAWTVCHDDERNTYEFKITMEEYDSYKIRGTPKKSVIKPAAAASAPVAEAPAASSESITTPAASTTPHTPTPEVLGAATSTAETSAPPANATPIESASTSTPPSDAPPPTG